MSGSGTGYLNGMEVGFSLVPENFSMFTAIDHFECQPMLFISMLLFHIYLTCWFFKNHISNGQAFVLPWEFGGEVPSSATFTFHCTALTHPPWSTLWKVSFHSTIPLSLPSSNNPERMLPLLCAIVNLCWTNAQGPGAADTELCPLSVIGNLNLFIPV